MSKKAQNLKAPSLSDELVIDSSGRLRIKHKDSKGTLQQVNNYFSPSTIFITCGVLTIFLVDVLLVIFAFHLQNTYLLHNLEANKLFIPFTVMLLIGITGSLSLLLFVIYKMNVSNLEGGKVLVEIDSDIKGEGNES